MQRRPLQISLARGKTGNFGLTAAAGIAIWTDDAVFDEIGTFGKKSVSDFDV